MRLRNLILVILVLMVAQSHGANACTKSGGRFWLGQDTSASWIVKPGETCVHSITFNEGASAITEIQIAQRPKVGVAGTNGATNYAYKAPASSGTDQFAVRIVGERHGRKGSTLINIDVTIRP